MTNQATNNKLSGDSWILVPSVSPSEATTTTQSSLDTTHDTKTVSVTALMTFPTLSDNITNEIVSGEEVMTTDKYQETTLEPTSSEEMDGSSEYIGVTGTSSEEILGSEEEGEASTTVADIKPININLTSSASPGNTHSIH